MIRRSLFVFTVLFTSLLFVGCSSDDDSSSPEEPAAETVEELILGKWFVEGIVTEGKEIYFEDFTDENGVDLDLPGPCWSFEFFRKGRLERKGCSEGSQVYTGEYTILDEGHIELIDYNHHQDDAIARIHKISENKLSLEWTGEGGYLNHYFFER